MLTNQTDTPALFTPSVRDKFLSMVNKTDDCWLWQGVTHEYGLFTVIGVTISAHRYAYLLEHGSIDDGLHLHHLCRVKVCVNPAHLVGVTPQQHQHMHHNDGDAELAMERGLPLRFEPTKSDRRIIKALMQHLGIAADEVIWRAVRFLAVHERVQEVPFYGS